MPWSARSLLLRSDRVGAAYTDCLAFLPRSDGDITAHVPKSIASPDDRIASGLELDVALRECAELSDAGNGDGRRVIRYQGQSHGLIHKIRLHGARLHGAII